MNFESRETYESVEPADPDENPSSEETESDDSTEEGCEEGHGCDSICYFRDGAKYCGCKEGQKLATDMKTCLESSEISDYLTTDSCEKGFTKNYNGDCDDIDECEEDKHNCSIVEKCINTGGGFFCQSVDFCPNGFYFNGDSKKCEGEQCA